MLVRGWPHYTSMCMSHVGPEVAVCMCTASCAGWGYACQRMATLHKYVHALSHVGPEVAVCMCTASCAGWGYACQRMATLHNSA